jgi:hypothetical protein
VAFGRVVSVSSVRGLVQNGLRKRAAQLLLLRATGLRSFVATHLLVGLAHCRMPIAESCVLASSY